MPFSIKKFTMNRSSSLPGHSNQRPTSADGKKLTLAEIRDRMTGSSEGGVPSSSSHSGKHVMKKSASQDEPSYKAGKHGSRGPPPPLPTSRSVDAAELRRIVSLDVPDAVSKRGLAPLRLHEDMPTPTRRPASAMDYPQHHHPHHHQQQQQHRGYDPRVVQHQTLPNRWRSAGKSRSVVVDPRVLDYEQVHGETRRLVLRRNGVRFQDSDWGTEESQSTSSSSGGGGGLPRGHPATLKSSGSSDWADLAQEAAAGRRGGGSGGGSSGGEGSMRRSQPRRHHSVTAEHMSAANNTRLAMDLELGQQRPQSASLPTSPAVSSTTPVVTCNGSAPPLQDEKRDAILKHLQRKFPEHAHAIARRGAASHTQSQTHLVAQRNPALYQPPPSVYDDDPGIMSEVETSSTGFRRACKARSSLPIVRTPSKTQERPLGLVFLQYRSETKRALLPNEITTMDTVKALFVRSFPRQLTMEYLDSRHIRVYIHDPSKDMFYELEDLRDIRDRSVIRIYEQDSNGTSVYNTWDQDMSYFSEPEFDSEYQNQHIHRTKGSKSSAVPVVPVQSSNYYGIVSPYSAGSRTQSLPHGASLLRPYSPAPPVPLPEQRPKSQPVAGYCQTLPRGMHLPSYTPTPPSPPEKRPMDLLTPTGAGQPPPKPQRSFQQVVVPMAGKGMRSTPAPTGPPPSIPSPRSGQPRTLDRRHDPQGAYRTPPERPYSAGPGYHTSPERRYDPSYHSSPERRTQDSGYLSSPERRLDHQRSFPGYSSSSYDDSFYGERALYGSRSGSVTPVIDEEARIRVEFMERQLASLTGLVQKALQAEDTREAEVEAARQTFKEEKSVSFSDETTTVGSPVQKAHMPPTSERPAKPAIKSVSRSSTSERDPRLASGKPLPPPKPASLSGTAASEARHTSSPAKELHLSPEMYCQLRHLRKQTKDLRLEVRNLRRMAQAQAVTARETVRDTCYKIKAMLAVVQGGDDHVCAERLRVSREEDLYRQDVMHLEKDLAELESQVEELRSNVINRRCRVNMSDVESMALVLSRASKTVADLKARFPSLQESLKAVMAAEMEVVVREEKFLKEEPERLENALRRCKKLTGTLVTLKRLASVQEQRHTGGGVGGGHHPPEKAASADGPHSDGEAHNARTFDSNSHTVIHVPPDGHQRAPRTENALDALLDELQTFTKPGESKRDPIPGLNTPQRRLPSYPSSDSPIRSAQSFAPPIHPKPTGKLQVSEGGHRQSLNLSPSGSPLPDGKNDIYNRVVVGAGNKQTLINGPDTLPNPGPPLPIKKVPPPPPPRTTSRSPLTSPTTTGGSLRDGGGYGHSRSFSEPANKNLAEAAVQRIMAARSVTREEAENALKSIDESRRDQLSSNSSSSESVNSQEGLQMALQQQQQQQQQQGLVGGMAAKLERKASLDASQPGTPTRSRQELLEHRHQELLRKQKQLQEQYARLQQLQRGQVRFSPPRSALGDLKKTGSESNILSKTALSLTPSSGSLTHLAMTGSPSSMTLNPKLLSSGAGNAKPQPPAKIFETDIL